MVLLLRKKGSRGALAVSQALGARRVDTTNLETVLTTRKYSGSKVINWGIAGVFFTNVEIINHPLDVQIAANKATTFTYLADAGLPIPTCYFNQQAALTALESGTTKRLVCRTVLTGHSGIGIVIAEKPEDVVDCKLYTTYIKKSNEFRVHVVRDSAILIQKKIKLTQESLDERGITDTNRFIRNLDNGWVYTTNLSEESGLLNKLSMLSVEAVAALGLDFGAVDIIVDKKGNPFVLEINTAPGLCDVTLNAYAQHLSEILQE